ncbi:MAG TPA: EamA family transporter [Solirubrobacteraceae bacterium]|nr:EamA family transporter [Solirubrobacteraceae bacterium]
MVALTLALGASIAWGASDFLGGFAARRLPVVVVLLGAQAVGLALAATAWALAEPRLPAREAIALGVAAGLAELLGFACLYRGLAIGEMTAIAPLAALTAVLPIAVAVGGGEQVAALEAGGMLLAIAGSAAAAAGPGSRRPARGAGLGIGAALCFGVFLILLGEASESNAPAAVLSGRVGSVAVLAVLVAGFRTPGGRLARPDAVVIAALGALDVVANLAYASAAAGGADATVAVLASLYPLTTVLLARALLHERLAALRLAGVVVALGGLALISVSQ